MMYKICPQPDVWNCIYEGQLSRFDELATRKIHVPKPPIPLILNGWVFSGDFEKKDRWVSTKVWDVLYGQSENVGNLIDTDFYFGESLMIFDSLQNEMDMLIEAGVRNFESVSRLYKNECNELPNQSGIYVLCTPIGFKMDISITSEAINEYLGRNLLASLETLKDKTVPRSKILYIGKASGTSNHLKQRIRQLVRYGYGEVNNHRGGRYLWQVQKNKNFLVGFEPCEDADIVERNLIERYKEIHGKLPFANIR